MEDLQRVKKVIKWLLYMGYAETDSDLAAKMGYGKSGFSQLVNGRVHLSDNFIDKLSSMDSSINREWIRTGKGEMFIRPKNGHSIPSPALLGFTPATTVTAIPVPASIPLIPMESVDEFGTMTADYSACPAYVVPEFSQKGAEFAIRVPGSSMYPRFSPGDVVACRKIEKMLFFQWGSAYLMETSQGVLLKMVYPCPEEEDAILCVSENPEKFPSFRVPKADIKSCALVIGVIKME